MAASSGLTIPLQITLSNIKLSAFIILVFSKQKGLTLVFRNDPLESLKVSSTFDSIPFVRDYLQKEIEGQLRTLLMDEVPAIIHRLSLTLWVPEYGAREDELVRNGIKRASEEKIIDPLAGPPEDPVDVYGNVLDAAQVAALSLDTGSETHSLFSQKNLVRLAALTDSHRTLSLFTPGMRDVVFRAWAGPTERGEVPGNNTPVTPMHPTLSRMHSYTGSTSTTYSFPETSDTTSHAMRPTLTSYGSASSGLSLGAGRHSKQHQSRKRKHRVVNLRKSKPGTDDLESVSGDSTFSGTVSSAVSESGAAVPIPEQKEEELVTPPQSPRHKVRFQRSPDSIDLGNTPPRLRDLTPRQPAHVQSPSDQNCGELPPPAFAISEVQQPSQQLRRPKLQPSRHSQSYQYSSEKQQAGPSSSSSSSSYHPHPAAPVFSPFPYLESSPGGILEQAWMMKMASEIARRVQDEKAASNGNGNGNGNNGFWGADGQRERNERENTPPPAYGL